MTPDLLFLLVHVTAGEGRVGWDCSSVAESPVDVKVLLVSNESSSGMGRFTGSCMADNRDVGSCSLEGEEAFATDGGLHGCGWCVTSPSLYSTLPVIFSLESSLMLVAGITTSSEILLFQHSSLLTQVH